MPQRLQSLFNVSFVKGLVTEAGELTFPENASVDELNCTLERTANRRRRLAAKVDSSSSPSSETYLEGQVVTTSTWENVGGQESIQFAVVQIGNKLRFYDKSYEILSDGEVPISDSDPNPYILDMSTFQRAGGLGASQAPIQVASVKGSLVVASPEINTFYIERDLSDNSFSATEIEFRVRDYEFLGDTSTYYTQEDRDFDPIPLNLVYEEDTTLLNYPREYDSKNTGWVRYQSGSPYYAYVRNQKKYPPLNIPWFSAKNSSEDFVTATFVKLSQEAQTSLMGNGHFILDLYNGDRWTAFSSTDTHNWDRDTFEAQVENLTEDTRFSCVAAYAGRAFYAGMTSKRNASRIYYSQTLTKLEKLGECLQRNDPTSEAYFDRLDDDGGYIDIEEAYGIKRLWVLGNKLFVFADNGVWAIDGVDGVFRATEYRVEKVTTIGIGAAKSFAVVDGQPFWWSHNGIYTLETNQIGDLSVRDLSRTSIQTFWNNIDTDIKGKVFSEIDSVEKRIFWFYPNNSETVEGKVNNVLVYDLILDAFYPWTISDTTGDSPYIIGSSFYTNSGGQTVTATVIDNSGNTVVNGADTIIDAVITNVTGSSTKIKLLVYNSSDGTIQWGEFSGTDFLDWGSANYSSYAEARHDSMGDLSMYKNAPYIVVYLGVTETGWEASGTTYTPVRGSSCLVSAYWDWKTTPSSTAQQAYRLKFMPVVDSAALDTFGYPNTVLQTRLKLRGRGRSMRIRLESEQGKDFNLIGWGLLGAMNTRP